MSSRQNEVVKLYWRETPTSAWEPTAAASIQDAPHLIFMVERFLKEEFTNGEFIIRNTHDNETIYYADATAHKEMDVVDGLRDFAMLQYVKAHTNACSALLH
jgi:hypothetical protein